jgi:hypothetical protein
MEGSKVLLSLRVTGKASSVFGNKLGLQGR